MLNLLKELLQITKPIWLTGLAWVGPIAFYALILLIFDPQQLGIKPEKWSGILRN